MLNVDSDTICFIIQKARQFHAKEEVTIPETPLSPADDWGRQVLAAHVDDPVYLEFKATVDDLEPDQQAAMVALFWLGRGDYEANQWEAAHRRAMSEWNRNTADYLLSKPLLSDYLSEAMASLDLACEV